MGRIVESRERLPLQWDNFPDCSFVGTAVLKRKSPPKAASDADWLN
jgi:hypothetical protein